MSLPPPAPPPPPPPGADGSIEMPNWRSQKSIDKMQFACLPSALLNSLKKERKPFTYTPMLCSK